MQTIGGQRGKIRRQHRRRSRHDKAVEHTPRDIDGAVVPGIDQILQEMSLGQCLEPALQIRVGTRGVDDEHVERKQAKHR